jgi:hypothetical protein
LPITSGTTVAASPLPTHSGAAEVEVPVEAVTVEVVAGAATESSSVHPAKLRNPTTPTTRRTRGRTGAYCPVGARSALRSAAQIARQMVSPTAGSRASRPSARHRLAASPVPRHR